MKIKNTAFIFLIPFLFFQGCILEDFDTVPVNIPLALPVLLADPLGTQSQISYPAEFCLDSNDIYQDYQGKIKELTLVEVAFRFNQVIPATIAGDMTFILRKNDINGDNLINQSITGFMPNNYLIPGRPYILDLNSSQLEVMNTFLAQNGKCFYGYVEISNLSPPGTPKLLKGYVDMLFKAETEF